MPFKPGHHIGRPKKSEDLKELAKFSKDEITATFYRFLGLSVFELEQVLGNKSLSVLEHWVGRITLLGIMNGDILRLEFILVKIFGKAINGPDIINMIDEEIDDPDLLKKIPSSELIRLIRSKD